MLVDYERFEGLLPYASSMFGIYQPLLGWRGQRLRNWFDPDICCTRDGLIQYMSGKFFPDVRIAEVDHRGIEVQRLAIATSTPAHRFNLPSILDSRLGRRILEAINSKTPIVTSSNVVWADYVSTQALNDELQKIRRDLSAPTGFVPQNEAAIERAAKWESMVAGMLSYFYTNNMTAVLKCIFFPGDTAVDLSRYQNMLGLFGQCIPGTDGHDDSITNIALSPIGMIHLYRQYFFEFDSFLGPPVQHVWLSPGSTVELVETHSRTVTTERLTEISSESIQRTEESVTTNDEISDAVSNENTNNTKLGVSASVDGGFDVKAFSAHAAISGSFGYDTNTKKAREQLHKQSRSQSSKISNEIKRNFKTSLRTVTETTDTSSKRYVLTNTTSELINYELRRKMRQVLVQLQDIGTFLCWQTYVDNPGIDLGIAELVHIAEPVDLANLQAPTLAPEAPPEVVEMDIPFEYKSLTNTEEKDVTFFKGSDEETVGNNDRIVWKRVYQVYPPKPNYTLNADIKTSCIHTNTCVTEAAVVSNDEEKKQGVWKLELRLPQVNFDDQSAVNVKVTLRWDAPAGVMNAAFEEAKKTYDAEKERLSKEAFVRAARERIRLASTIQSRNSGDLREEERIVVYRKLIGDLLDVDVDIENGTTRHILSELISAIFDVDKMLYFVAPEWWRPRIHSEHLSFGVDGDEPVTRLTGENVVGWGGIGEKRKNNYYITEDSRPAKLGSSLGWLLQLDGDTMRNAFLNAPWVKAVLPMRPGMEFEALTWLRLAAVEGTEGLNDLYAEEVAGEKVTIADELKTYTGWKDAADIARYDASFSANEVTVGDAIKYLALKVRKKHEASNVLKVDVDKHYMPTDRVFDYGFDPTAVSGGFRATPSATDLFEVFDQWVEVLPTDQLVAVSVQYDPLTGRQIVPQP